MKRLINTFVLSILCISVLAQAPQMFNYQAVLRNDSGEPIPLQSVTVTIEILKGSATGNSVFSETHNTQTNKFGLINLQIGSEESLDGVDWAADDHFIEIIVDGTSIGTTRLLGAPYALYAGSTTETDPVFNAWDKSTGISITESQISDLGAYIETETDPVFDAWDKSTGISITESQISDFGTYIETETDPVFNAWDKSTGISITESQISDLGTYIETETDPVFNAWDKSTGISITESQISDLGTYIEAETDPVFMAWDKDYNDLTNTPNILDSINTHGFDGQYSSLAGQPTNLSDFTNDMGFITEENQQLSVSDTGDTLRLENGGFVIIPGISVANSPDQLASLTTSAVTEISSHSAVSGGNITDEGLGPIIARGVCWSTSMNPTTANSHTTDGTGTGSFTSDIAGLLANTTYYVRAYATNSVGTSYGNQQSFTTIEDGLNSALTYGTVTDIDGNTYATIEIGTQEWMAQNLRTSRYRNGDIIPNVPCSEAWNDFDIGAWTHYDDDSSYDFPYGKMYNWHAADDPRGICPTGWSIPTDAEWEELADHLGGATIAGGLMKSSGTEYWTSPNANANNQSGFSGLPGGYMWTGVNLGFWEINNFGSWWTATETSGTIAISRGLFYNHGNLTSNTQNKTTARSIRCIKD